MNNLDPINPPKPIRAKAIVPDALIVQDDEFQDITFEPYLDGERRALLISDERADIGFQISGYDLRELAKHLPALLAWTQERER